LLGGVIDSLIAHILLLVPHRIALYY
jgi:hypothetical protein